MCAPGKKKEQRKDKGKIRLPVCLICSICTPSVSCGSLPGCSKCRTWSALIFHPHIYRPPRYACFLYSCGGWRTMERSRDRGQITEAVMWLGTHEHENPTTLVLTHTQTHSLSPWALRSGPSALQSSLAIIHLHASFFPVHSHTRCSSSRNPDIAGLPDDGDAAWPFSLSRRTT